jgi:ribosomal peptide maturation radical SAM protein 1
MPWASPRFPSLGVASLRSTLLDHDMACDALYANLAFSALIGGNPFYEEQLAQLPIAEAAFSPHYFDTFSRRDAARAIYASVRDLGDGAELHSPAPAAYLDLVDTAGVLLDRLIAETDWSAYDIVGFSVMMQQTVASLALARRIKAVRPDVRVIFGGPNCSSPMGNELVRAFAEVDYVVEGEAELSLPPLVRELRDPDGRPLSVPGVIGTVDGVVIAGPPAAPVQAMDDMAMPDLTPFFEQLGRHAVTHVEPYLVMEASRGCWWGQKHHCSFCSLDDRVISFRCKSEDRVLAEVTHLARAFGRHDFFFTDSIIGHRYYTSLLPELGRLREQGTDLTFFFEAKSNMRRDHAQRLRYAGARIVQPGIESLSDHVLALMDKGATGIQQLQCLKFLAEAGITAYWNLLTGTPGETVADYDETIRMIGYMHHLPPLRVDGVTPTLIMRFSPYEQNPSRYGLGQLLPDPSYRFIFPRPDIQIQELAYYFTADDDRGVDPDITLAIGRLKAAVLAWRNAYTPDGLTQRRGEGWVEIRDSRRTVTGSGQLVSPPAQVTTLSGVQAELFLACDEVTTEAALGERFADRLPVNGIREFLDRMLEQRLVYQAANGRLINLPLWPDANLVSPLSTPDGSAQAKPYGRRAKDVLPMIALTGSLQERVARSATTG